MPSALFGRERCDFCGQFLMRVRIDAPVLHGCTRRIFAEEVVAFPVPRRPNRARAESATTIRADVSEQVSRARPAERAFETADHRFERFGRQFLVAVFTGGSELEHCLCPDSCANASPGVLRNGPEQSADSGGQPHGESAPECDAQGAHGHAGAARARGQRAKQGEEHQ